MKSDVIKALLPLINARFDGTRSGGWVLASCPLAPWNHADGVDKHPSFGIKASDTTRSLCKCFSCGYTGQLDDLVFELNIRLKHKVDPRYDLSAALKLVDREFDELEYDPHIPDFEAFRGGVNTEAPTEVVYPEEWLSTFQSVMKFEDGRAYLRGRGWTSEMVKNHDVRYDPIQRRVCFPFRNFKGELMGVQGRAIDKDNDLRYYFYGWGQQKNMHVWLGEHHLDLDKPIVLVEGPFDYARVHTAYRNVAASFSAGVSKAKLMRLADASEIITLYDAGAGGDAARDRIRKVLKVPILDLVPTSVDEDAADMTTEELAEALDSYVVLNAVQ